MGFKRLFRTYFAYFQNFGTCRNFYGSEHFFENFDLWVKNFQKFFFPENDQNDHFSTFDDFFFDFGEIGLSCPNLPRFASQTFLGTWEAFFEN